MDELVRIRYVGTDQVRELPKRNAAGLVSRGRAVYVPVEDKPKRAGRRKKAEPVEVVDLSTSADEVLGEELEDVPATTEE